MLLFSRFGMGRAGKTGPSIPSVTGPGPSTLAYGDATMGFFGEVASSDFISGSALATAIGLTTGILVNDTTSWLKFILDGKILFIPKMHIRHTVSWQSIYQAGAVYGDNTNGTFPAGSARVQNAAVSVGSNRFAVRLLCATTGDNTPYDTKIALSNSEWNRLIYPICLEEIPNHNYGSPLNYNGPKWNLFTETDLDIFDCYTVCKDKNPNALTNRFARGYSSLSYVRYTSITNASSIYGWRPCLVLK